MPFTVIFEYPTIRLLATHILYLLNTPDTSPIGTLLEADAGAPALLILSSSVDMPQGMMLARECQWMYCHMPWQFRDKSVTGSDAAYCL